MILESIVLENIRSYSRAEVVFPRGTTLFEGDIGSGKSTVLMAIEFALFGLGSQKAESLLAKKSESGFVILEFSVDEKKYEVRRTLKRDGASVKQDSKNSWIIESDEKQPLSPSEIKQRVLQILRFNEPADPRAGSKIFRYAVFTPQESMKEVLSDSTKRLETIRRAFGIEDYSNAASNATIVLSILKSRMDILRYKSSNISELEETITKSKSTVSELDEKITKLSKLIDEKQDDKKRIQIQIKDLQEKREEQIRAEREKTRLVEVIDSDRMQIRQIEKDITEYESEIKENDERLQGLAGISRPETKLSAADVDLQIKKFQQISDDLIKYNSDKNSVLESLSKLEDQIGKKPNNTDVQDMERKIQELTAEGKSLESRMAETQDDLDKIKSQKAVKYDLKQRLEKEIAEFEQLGNNCPTCKQEITEEHHRTLVGKKHDEVASLTVELEYITNLFFESDSKSKKLQDEIDSCKNETDRLVRVLPAYRDHPIQSSKLSEIKAKIIELNESRGTEYGENPVKFLSDLKESLVRFDHVAEERNRITMANQKMKEKIVQKQSDTKRLESKVDEQELKLASIKSQLETFEDVSSQISKLESELDEHGQEITEISKSHAAFKTNADNEKQKISETEKMLLESKKWREKFRLLSQFEEWLKEFFIPTISMIEHQVLLTIQHDFNETYKKWYSILVEDPTKESSIDENFTPIISQDGYEQDVQFLSGGEKTSIALAYRLALNLLMRREIDSMSSSLLILDEPTDGFSKNQLGKMRDLFDELQSKQIVIVSHERELETYVDNIFKISKDDGTSRISKYSAPEI